MTGIIQVAVITRQHFGQIATFCLRCDEIISFKVVREDGSYTQLCKCGCNLFQFHAPDEFHKNAFFTRRFISSKKYDPKMKNKHELEKIGFKKTTEKNGKVVFTNA